MPCFHFHIFEKYLDLVYKDNNQMILSSHAKARIETRLNSLTSCQEVIIRVNQFHVTEHRYFIEVKRFPYCEIQDRDIKPDGIARGNSLVAICERDTVESVVLRKSWSQSGEFRKIHKNPN